MNEDSLFDIIKDCTKIFNEIKKKKNENLNTSLTNCLNNLNMLKENISQKNKEKIEENLLSISISFIESTKQIIELKYTKFYLNILILIKKFIEYSIFSQEKSSNLVEILSNIYNNSKTNDECQNKVLEILQSLIFTSFFEIKFDILSNIYLLILNSFCNTNNSKNKDFKNPIRLLFTTITEKVYKSNNLEIIIQITILIFSWYKLSLQKKIESYTKKNSKEKSNNNEKEKEKDNGEGGENIENHINFSDEIDDKLKEKIIKILNQKKNHIYIQCLSIELLSEGFNIIHNKKEDEKYDKFDIKFLDIFIKEKILKSFIFSLDTIKNNNSSNEESSYYILYLKILKFIKIVLFNYKVDYNIIESILDIIKDNDKNQNKISWKIKLTFEFLCNIITNYELLEKIGKWKIELIQDIFTSINNFIDNIEALKEDKDKENKKTDSIICDFMKKKEIDNNKIYIEGDEIIILKEKSKRFYKNIINDCLIDIIDCYIKDNFNKNNENKIVKNKLILDNDIFDIVCKNIKDIIFKLLKNEMNKNENISNENDGDMKIYINYIKNMIELFNNLNMKEKIIEYFKNISELALDFGEDKNNNEEKNIFIALSLVDLLKTTRSLNKDIFVIILQTIEVFNHKYNKIKLDEYSENDLDKIIKDINEMFENYKNPSSGDNKQLEEEKQLEENKENNNEDNLNKKESKEVEKEKNDNNENNEKKEDDKEKDKEKAKDKVKDKEKDKMKEKDKLKEKEKEKENYRNELKKKLCEVIDKLFIDSENLDLESLKDIIGALLICIDSSIKKNKEKALKKSINTKENENETNNISNKTNNNKDKDKKSINKSNSLINGEEDTFNYEIIFYFSKILTVTVLNIDKIYILFDPFIEVINKLVDNKIMVNFSIDILCTLIPEVLLNYDNIKININKNLNEDNKIWINERWQKLLFSPLLTILSQIELFEYIKEKIFVGLNKIIQQSGHFIDSYGWESIIQSCIILSNYDIEKTFITIKSILNDYNIYLTLFNIIPIMKLLQTFILSKNDKNISFSSVELFWSCANIIDDFKQKKRVMEESEKPIFDKFLKGKELNIYCDELFYKLFSYLLSINEDERIDVRKSGLNVFTEIFVNKMNNINLDINLKIINDIFFKIFADNADKFIKDNKNYSLERAIQISLLNIQKILKELYNEKEGENKIFENYLNKVMELIPYGTPYLNTDILKSIVEIKLNKNENVSMIVKKLDFYFKIILLLNDYIKSPNFVYSQFNKAPAYRLFNHILTFIGNIFLDPNYLEVYTDENLKIIFDLFNTLFETIYSIEGKLLEIKPRKIIEFENEIFALFEKMLVQNNSLFNYIINKINFDFSNIHSDAITKRSLECLHNIICKKENKYKFGLKNEEFETLKQLIVKVNEIILLTNKKDVIECLAKSQSEGNDVEEKIPFHIYLDYLIKIIDEICNHILKFKEELKEEEIKEDKNELINDIYEFFISILDLFESIFNQHVLGFKSISQEYYPLINEVYNLMEIDSIQFIINKLLFYILFIFGDKDENIYKIIEERIFKLIKLICDTPNTTNNENNLSLPSLNNVCINELLKICQYKSNEEIMNEINDKKIINMDKYINNKIKVGKIFAHLAIQKIIDILKKFREDETKSGDMPLSRVRIKEIVDLLENIKNLEIYPEINIIEKKENYKNEKKEITVFDVLSKTKKIHLFYLQPILNDFFDTKEKEIKNSVKDIFLKITDIIGMPKLGELNI